MPRKELKALTPRQSAAIDDMVDEICLETIYEDSIGASQEKALRAEGIVFFPNND